ncbi:uncharacterized mitochondrial protein-like protein [Tanacetum coccineum]
MTGNKCYLTEYEDYHGGFVSFRDGKAGISGKGKIKSGTLVFDDVYFCKELKYNLFSVSQICDKKNNVLFTDTECLVLSSDFKLLDESQATIDESNLWHRRLGHINFKNMNKLVRGNLVRGLPSKIFELTNVSFIACQKGKQHKASYETCRILKTFITEIENLLDHKVKVIRSDNGTEFKNSVMNQLCENESKAMRVFNKRTKIVEETLNIRFLENAPNVTGNGPDWLFDVDSLSKSMNYVPVVAGNQTNGITGTRDNIVADVLNVSPMDDNIGIFAGAYDDEDVGGQTDLNNLETTMNVSSIPITRSNKDHPIELIIGDLHSAPLTRRMSQQNLKEHCLVSYINNRRTNNKDYQNCLFACFLSQKEPKKVIQALEDPSWIETMQEELLQFELQKVWILVDLPNGKRAIGIKWIFRNKKDEEELLLETRKDWLHKMLHKRFQMSSIGELTFFLGLQVQQKEDGIFISQDKYVADILKKFDYVTVKTASTPMEPNKALVKDEEADNVDVHLYRSMIRSLMYLTAFRPNITFAVCACARFQVTPKTSHLHAVKRIFRYLKGQPKLGLWYPRDSPFDLEAFSDSDYAGASLDRKSTTGGVGVIEWKRAATTASSLEAEQDIDAQTSTLEDGDMGITAIIDGKVKVVSKAYIRRHLKLEDSDGISTLSTIEIFKQLALMSSKKTAWEQFSSNIATAIICLATNKTFNFSKLIFEAMVKNLDKAAPMPHDSPLLRVHSLGSDEGSLTLNELTVLCTSLSKKVESLESDLKQTKQTYGVAYTKLIMKVKKLERKVKSIKARRTVRLVISDDEDDLEDPSKQGRKIA